MTEQIWYASAVLGVVAFAAILWRTISCWRHTSDLVRILGILLAASLIIGAMAAFTRPVHTGSEPIDIARIIHRTVVLVAAAAWPLLERNTISNWLSRPRRSRHP